MATSGKTVWAVWPQDKLKTNKKGDPVLVFGAPVIERASGPRVMVQVATGLPEKAALDVARLYYEASVTEDGAEKPELPAHHRG